VLINKKTTAISITMMIIMAAPLLFYAGYFIKQKQIQSQMVSKLKHNILSTITIKQDDIKCVKSNKEILVNGRLFDVNSIVKKADCFEITGLFDVDEDLLQKELTDFNNQKNKGDSPINQLMKKYLSSDAFFHEPDFSFATNVFGIQCFYSTYSGNVIQQLLPVDSPPPKA
jgi:hypothetical protein